MRGASLAVLAAVCTLAGCEIAEVTTAPAEDVVVVEAVLRAGSPRQVVLLHRSVQEETVRGEEGARVTVLTPEGREVAFSETPLSECTTRLTLARTDTLRVEATCYTAEEGLEPRPGATYQLRVQTRDGGMIRGRTTVPGAFALRAPDLLARHRPVCALPPGTNLPLVWSVSQGAWSYVSVLEITGLQAALAGTGIRVRDRVELTGLSISERDTTLVLPAEFGVFDLGEVDQELLKLLQAGFPADVAVNLTIAAVDRNFVNSVRGGGFNPSGNVRISSVVGDGVGVFGSAVPLQLRVLVGEKLAAPSCL